MDDARRISPADGSPAPDPAQSAPSGPSSSLHDASSPSSADAHLPHRGGINAPQNNMPHPTTNNGPNDHNDCDNNIITTAVDNASHHDDKYPTEDNDVNAILPTEDEVALRVKWGSSLYAVELPLQSTVSDLKRRIFELTEVLPKRQKVFGLSVSGGRLPDNDLPLTSFNLKPDQRVMVVGSREEDISAVNNNYLKTTAVVNDFDVDYSIGDSSTRVLRDPVSVYRRRLERRIETTEVRIMHEPRDGKKCLVLDLDNTLLDCHGSAASIADLGRPGLHQFLASAYRNYDIVIWSQTSWRWLEAKLTGLSMLFAEDYKVSFVLDRTSMFSVTSRKHSQERTHEVKALEIIWRKFPNRWNASNTVHIDDLSRNFALNPQCGLKISPFKCATPEARRRDVELYLLAHYLTIIAQGVPDFTTLNHKHWKRFSARQSQRVQDLSANRNNNSAPH